MQEQESKEVRANPRPEFHPAPANNHMQVTPPDQITAMTLIDKAVSSGMSVETLDRLMDLGDRIDAKRAQQAFNVAISEFQATCPTIVKLKEMRTGNAVSLYAPLGDIAEQIRETLRKCQLSFRFRIEDLDGGGIRVTCIVAHSQGHAEETSMRGDADTSGSKNAIQSIGSTVTYLQRYTLVGALGLTTADSDMDGRLHPTVLTKEQLSEMQDRIKAADVNLPKFLAYMKVEALGDIKSADFAKADQALKDQEKKMATKKPAAKAAAQPGEK